MSKHEMKNQIIFKIDSYDNGLYRYFLEYEDSTSERSEPNTKVTFCNVVQVVEYSCPTESSVETEVDTYSDQNESEELMNKEINAEVLDERNNYDAKFYKREYSSSEGRLKFNKSLYNSLEQSKSKKSMLDRIMEAKRKNDILINNNEDDKQPEQIIENYLPKNIQQEAPIQETSQIKIVNNIESRNKSNKLKSKTLTKDHINLSSFSKSKPSESIQSTNSMKHNFNR